MRVGLGMTRLPFASGRALWRWVDLCEHGGVDSLWQSDRLVSTEPFLEALTAVAALAGRTERLRFGMNAVVAGLRDPLLLAKQCATVDFLSGGRLLPVFGVGDAQAPEWRATGAAPAERGRRADEVLEIVRRLWSEDAVSHTGTFFRYESASIRPRPIQRPLPLWIGGSSDAAIRRTARFGTGWIGGIETPAQIAAVVPRLRAACAAAGNPLDEDHIGALFPYRFGRLDDPVLARDPAARLLARGAAPASDFFAVGDAQTVLDRIEEYRLAGAAKLVLFPIAEDEADWMRQTQRLVDEVLPVVHRERGAERPGPAQAISRRDPPSAP
jgi:probable F420-dependent oxidoreductase